MSKLDKLIYDMKEARDKAELFRIKDQLILEADRLKKYEEKLNLDRSGFSEDEIESQKEAQKDVEKYSQSFAAFYNSSLEKFKSLLTLSVGIIGFSTGVVSLGEGFDKVEVVIVGLVIFLFSISAIFSILIFDRNSKYLAAYIKLDSDDRSVQLKYLNFFSDVVFWTFSLGLLSLASFGGYRLFNIW